MMRVEYRAHLRLMCQCPFDCTAPHLEIGSPPVYILQHISMNIRIVYSTGMNTTVSTYCNCSHVRLQYMKFHI